MTPAAKNAVLVVLYSSGGTADVGRHAVRAAMDLEASVFSGKIRVISKDPQTTLIDTKKWNSFGEHTFTDDEKNRLELIAADVTEDDLSPHLQGENIVGVVSALGNRQPFYGDRVAYKGTRNLLGAMKSNGVSRLVAITSTGLNEDWPAMEFHWAGKILTIMFLLTRSHVDLQRAENEVTKHAENNADLDYLFVRPVGIGEDFEPVGKWSIQDRKHGMRLAPDMSKLDCARFAVSQIFQPTYHRRAVVIGSDLETYKLHQKKSADAKA